MNQQNRLLKNQQKFNKKKKNKPKLFLKEKFQSMPMSKLKM